MNNNSNNNNGTEDASDVRAAVQYSVIQICSEEDAGSTTKMSPRALAALAELTYRYATGCLAADLAAFAEHAGRRTVTDADVKLVARKNEGVLRSLQEKLDEYALNNDGEADAAGAATRKNKKRRTTKKKAPVIDLQGKGASTTDRFYEASSEDSSSDEEMMFEKTGAAAAAAARSTKKGASAEKTAALKSAIELLDSSGDSDMEIPKPRSKVASKKTVAAARTERRSSLHNTDSDESAGDKEETESSSKPKKKKKTARPHAERRFRLTSQQAGDKDEETESEDDFLLDDPFKKASVRRQTQVESIMANLSMDSVQSPAGNENTEET
jgi:histone H3/H4